MSQSDGRTTMLHRSLCGNAIVIGRGNRLADGPSACFNTIQVY